MTNEEHIMLEEKWIESLKECKKLKEDLENERNWIAEFREREINSLQENTKLKAEIDELRWKLSSVETQRDLKGYNAKRNADIMSNQLEIIKGLKAEIEELKEDISQLNNECAGFDNENKLLKAEIERLKEELEQSVKLPCKVGDEVYVLAECKSISPRLDGTLYDSSGGFGTATGYYCPYEDNCPHIDSDCDCTQLQSKTAIFEDEINGFMVENNGNILISTEYCGLLGNLNEYIFLTREEAEQSLKGVL